MRLQMEVLIGDKNKKLVRCDGKQPIICNGPKRDVV
jgi:hypothetical protein